MEHNQVKKLNQLQIKAEKFACDIFNEQAETLQNGDKEEINEMLERFDTYAKELEENMKRYIRKETS